MTRHPLTAGPDEEDADDRREGRSVLAVLWEEAQREAVPPHSARQADPAPDRLYYLD